MPLMMFSSVFGVSTLEDLIGFTIGVIIGVGICTYIINYPDKDDKN